MIHKRREKSSSKAMRLFKYIIGTLDQRKLGQVKLHDARVAIKLGVTVAKLAQLQAALNEAHLLECRQGERQTKYRLFNIKIEAEAV